MTAPRPHHGVNAPYDWDNYQEEFIDGPAYRQQEAALAEVFTSLALSGNSPRKILEVGPGLGRITKLLVKAFDSPTTRFALLDVSEAAIEKTSALPELAHLDFAYEVGRIQDPFAGDASPAGIQGKFPTFPFTAPDNFDLVVAVEVLMHVPPDEVEQAIDNLIWFTGRGKLITCDWTERLPGNPTVRVQNYRHDYWHLYADVVGVLFDGRQHVGLQTIFLVEP